MVLLLQIVQSYIQITGENLEEKKSRDIGVHGNNFQSRSVDGVSECDFLNMNWEQYQERKPIR